MLVCSNQTGIAGGGHGEQWGGEQRGGGGGGGGGASGGSGSCGGGSGCSLTARQLAAYEHLCEYANDDRAHSKSLRLWSLDSLTG